MAHIQVHQLRDIMVISRERRVQFSSTFYHGREAVGMALANLV